MIKTDSISNQESISVVPPPQTHTHKTLIISLSYKIVTYYDCLVKNVPQLLVFNLTIIIPTTCIKILSMNISCPPNVRLFQNIIRIKNDFGETLFFII